MVLMAIGSNWIPQICHIVMPISIPHLILTFCSFVSLVIGIAVVKKLFSSAQTKLWFILGLSMACLAEMAFLVNSVLIESNFILECLNLVCIVISISSVYLIYYARLSTFDANGNLQLIVMVFVLISTLLAGVLTILKLYVYQDIFIVTVSILSELYFYYCLVNKIDFFLFQKPRLLRMLYFQTTVATVLIVVYYLLYIIIHIILFIDIISVINSVRLISVAHFYYCIINDMKSSYLPTAQISNYTHINGFPGSTIPEQQTMID